MFETQLTKLQQHHLIRSRLTIVKRNANHVVIHNKKLINFSSNDYLNLANHLEVKKSLITGVKKYGIASTASALVSGYHQVHQQLEETFATFLKRERAILFSSGYLANIGLIGALTQRSSTIFADKHCHASIIDGLILSKTKFKRYAHNNYSHLKQLLQQAKENDLVITESVFSMEGNITDIQQISTLTQTHHAMLIVDDAHGFGVLGENGGGICEHFALSEKEVPLLVVPLGKALGNMGAIVAGPSLVVEKILQFARSYRYSSAIPPAIAYAAATALKIMQEENWRRQKLLDIIHGDNQQVMDIQLFLKNHGFLVAAIRPPTVMAKTARIRISLNCTHKKQDILKLLFLIRQIIYAQKS